MKIGPLQMLILQPTSYCNLQCTYCYLTDKDKRTLISVDVVRATLDRIQEAGLVEDGLRVLWHAGEPLAIGVKRFRMLVETIAQHAPSHWNIRHVVQTNATLIDDAYCQLFKDHDFMLGVSIDGPERLHNIYRKNRLGQGSFAATMQGIAKLQKNDLKFSTISVLSTPQLEAPDEIFHFIRGLGAEQMGFNVEEQEGAHQSAISFHSADAYLELYTSFMRRILELSTKYKTLGFCRELRRGFAGLALLAEPKLALDPSLEAMPFGMLTVGTEGSFSTFSPELLGNSHHLYGDFAFGSVLTDSLAMAMQTPKFQKIWEAIQQGVQACASSCQHFNVCHGGRPVNKLFENGSFDSTETVECRATMKTVNNLIIETLLSSIDPSASTKEILCPTQASM